MAITRMTKGSELHHQGEFLRNYYTFESVHDGDRDSVVRIFIGLSCELGGFFNYIILREQFFPYQECNIRQWRVQEVSTLPVLSTA